MSHELIYTSVARGLRAGASGFCTVAMTARMPDAMAERLESLSGYRPVFPLGDPQVADNPVVWAYWRVTIGDRVRSVLSRVAFAGADYSQRSNKFAHHIIVEPGEQPPAGPAWVLRQPGVMESTWPGHPCVLPAGRAIPAGDRPASICKTWQSIAGDAGWAGLLADAFRNSPTKPAYLIYNPGTDPLPLIEEALALLPAAMRWQVTFSTYFTDLPMGATCAWRCVVAGTPAAKEAMRMGARSLVIDLTEALGSAPDGPLTQAARTGHVPVMDVAPPVSARGRIPPSLREAELQSPQDRAASRQKRWLGPPPIESLARETDSDMPPLASAPLAPAGANRHMRGWVVAILCVGCLAAAGAGGYLIVTKLIKRGPSDAPPTAQTKTATDPTQGRRQSGGRENQNSTVQSQPSLRPTPKEDAPVQKPPIGAKVAQTQPTRQETPRPPQPSQQQPQPNTPQLTKPQTSQPSTPAHDLPPANASTPAPAATQSAADGGEAIELPPVLDPNSLVQLDPIVHPLPKPQQTLPQTQPTTDWQVLGVDRIAVLLPNGDTHRALLAGGELKIERDKEGIAINLYTKSSEPGTAFKKRTVGRFVIKAGLVSFASNFDSLKNKPQLVPEIRSVIESSTILAARSAKEWTSLLSFRDRDAENTSIRIPFDSPRSIAIAPMFAKDVFLVAKDARGGGWESTPDGTAKVVLKKRHEGGFLQPVIIAANVGRDADSNGLIPFRIATNWDAGKKAYAKEHYQLLLAFGNEGRMLPPLTIAPGRADVLEDGAKWQTESEKWEAQAAKLENSVKAENNKQMNEQSLIKLKELRSKIESKRPRLDIYHRLLDLEKQADEFQAIGPIDGELRLQNGLPVGHFTLDEVPQKLKWTPPP